MIASTEAIVLQQIKYNDSSLILKVYSRLFGIISLFSPISKRKGSKSALFQTLSLVELAFYLRNNRGIQRLKEIHTAHPIQKISYYPGKTAQAIFIAELISKSVREEEENTALFTFLEDSILFFDSWRGEMPDFHIKFMLDFTRYLGFKPDDNFSQNNPWFSFKEGTYVSQFRADCADFEMGRAISQIMRTPYEELYKLSLNGKSRSELVRVLLYYYQWQLPSVKEFKTPSVLAEIFG